MLRERANAKINVYLNVTNRRENGYHDILSVMQTVSLCDILTVDFQPAPQTRISLGVSGNGSIPTDCRNLAYRAAERFLQKTGIAGVVTLFLEKHIPTSAGLAGGSADAAAVLRALNVLCGSPLPLEALCSLGTTIGADVPFCIRGGSAVVTGIGDEMKSCTPMPQELFLVVACRGEGVSTPWAYGELDRTLSSFADVETAQKQVDALLLRWENGDAVGACKHYSNLFEPVVSAAREDVGLLKRTMLAHGACHAMMSGSGPSVFGSFLRREDAQAACEALCALGSHAFVCHPKPAYSL